MDVDGRDQSLGVERGRQLRPDAFDALEKALRQAQAACPAELLPLCRARIRMLFGTAGADETVAQPKLDALADYATSAEFSAAERLALEFTEQYVMDVSAMPDELVAALHAELGTEQLYAFVMGLYAVDQYERLRLSAAVHPGAAQ